MSLWISLGGYIYPEQLKIQAKAYILKDLESNQIVLQENAKKTFPIASLAKLTTALITREYFLQNEWILVPNIPLIHHHLESRADLKVGEEYQFQSLLYALLLPSGNDVARVLDHTLQKKKISFANLAQDWTRRNALNATKILEPIGLSEKTSSSPEDLIKVLDMFHSDDQLYEILNSDEKSISSKSNKQINLKNRNPLPEYKSFSIYGKTGTTKKAGQCFAGFIRGKKSSKMNFAIVFLGSKDIEKELKSFSEFILKKHSSKTR